MPMGLGPAMTLRERCDGQLQCGLFSQSVHKNL
jgi:hypothetical protein